MPACSGPFSPIGHIDPKDFERTFAVNVTANYRLIRSLDPLLQAVRRRAARCSSPPAPRATAAPTGRLYAATKAALETLVRAYAAELAVEPKAKVNVFNPGRLRTDDARPGVSGRRSQRLPAAVGRRAEARST